MERVESEVVLICDGNNKEGACDMLCWDVKIECSMRDTTLHAVLNREALEPHKKNHVSGSVKCACFCEWSRCGVQTSRRVQRNRHYL